MTKIFEFPNKEHQLEMYDDRTVAGYDSVIHIVLRDNNENVCTKSIVVTPKEFELMIDWYNKTYKGEKQNGVQM